MDDILSEARQIVNGQRRKDYGNARESFSRIAAMWGAYLGVPVTALDVAHMMMMLKINRGVNGYKHDNILDIIGYSYCAYQIHEED